MKKLSKRLLAMLLVAVMVVAAIPFGAFAETPGTANVKVMVGSDEVATISGVAFDTDYASRTDKAAYTQSIYNGLSFANKDCYALTAGAEGDYTSVPTFTITVSLKDDHTHVMVAKTGAADGSHPRKCSVIGCTFEDAVSCTAADMVYGGVQDANEHTTKCKVCNKAGAPEAHKYVVKTAAVAATCESNGTTAVEWCSVCFHIKEGTGATIPALGHNYVAGVCTRCSGSQATTEYTVKLYKSQTPSLLASDGKIQISDSAASALGNNVTDARRVLSNTTGAAVYGVYAIGADTSNFVSLGVDATAKEISITFNKDLSAAAQEAGFASVDVYVNDEEAPRETGRRLMIGTYYFDTTLRNYGGKVEKIRVRNGNNLRTINYGDTDSNAKVQDGDTEITLLWDASEMTIYFLRDSSNFQDVVTTKKVYFGYRLGTLPQLDGRDVIWYVKGEAINEDTIYDWTGGTYVYATPRATGDVQLIIYANGVTKTPYIANPIDVTSKVQPGGLLKASALTTTIENAVGKKNLSITGLFDEAGWDYYVDNNKSTKYQQTSLDVNSALNRTGTQFVYVMVNNASSSTADASNPKTGDTAMIGTAAVVMALAAVGMGTAFYMKKKELF